MSANFSTGLVRPGRSTPDSPSQPISWITADEFFKSDALLRMDPVLRMLLMSDGSTTALLQALWLSPIRVEVILQKELPLNPPTAAFLGAVPGADALTREAWLTADGRRLVYASSVILIEALPRPLLRAVSGRQKPLGLLFQETGQAVLRDRLQIAPVPDAAAIGTRGRTGGPFWMRRYRMSLGTRPGPRPVASIQEQFIGAPFLP
ncbi:MAG TPA: chorismate pyruvate-lyase family protein [Nitrospiria bacterium]|nr:chorismate pyruvate-lyase family protein [Nitrospiria bacterium]